MAKISRHQHKEKIAGLKRGEIYLVSFDRPALVIQNDVGNQYSPLTIMAAITSKIPYMPFPVEVIVAPSRTNGLSARSAIRLDQIRTMDRRRLIRRLGIASKETMREVDQAIKISLGLVALDAA